MAIKKEKKVKEGELSQITDTIVFDWRVNWLIIESYHIKNLNTDEIIWI